MTKPAIVTDEPVDDVQDYQYGEPTKNGPRWLTREEFFAGLADAEAQLDRGEGIPHDVVMAKLWALQAALEAK